MVELHKIDPRPHLPRDAITIGRSYSSTREALEAGNYPVALSLAGEDDPESLAMAAIMCGAVVPGLALLQSIARRTSMARLYEGFALWCLEDRDGAAEILGGLVGTEAGGPARGLEKAVNRPALDVVLLSMPGSDKAASYENVPGFRIFRRSLDADGFGTSMADLLAGLPDRAEVDFLINLDAFGPYLPLGAGLDGPPLVSWSSDYDFFFATRHGDYAASTVVIANSAAEHDEINAIHSARVAAFPGHDSYGWSTAFPPPAGLKEVDVLFTGRAFVPYMRDKAQFLFRLATLDDAAARIAIHDDYMNDERYLKAMASARFVATHLRYKGGVQTRTIDALRHSTSILSNDRGWAGDGLDGVLGEVFSVDPESPEADILALLSEGPAKSGQAPDRAARTKAFAQLFWPSPARESRFLKFCYFQTLLADGEGREKSDALGPVPVELRGYGVEWGVPIYSAISKANLSIAEKTPAHMNFAGAAAFYGAILLPGNQKMGRLALNIFRAGLEAFPQALVLRFNYARALWLFGVKVEACAQFEQILSDQDITFDATRDALLSHRVKPLSEMFPYGDYYRVTVEALRRGDEDFSQSKSMIRAGARTFLGLAAMEQGEEKSTLAHLREAVAGTRLNFPAYRLLTIGLAKSGEQGGELLDAFYRAVNLYPPYLGDLLPIGVAGEINRQKDEAALELIRKWIMFQLRRLDGAGMPLPASTQSLETALHYQGRLDHWTAEALALIVAGDKSNGLLPQA